MRLFIGISPTEEIQTALVGAQELLAGHGVTGAYLTPENLHMKLAYIGEHPEPFSVLDAMDTVHFAPFKITCSHLGAFQKNIAGGGIEESEPLKMLVRRLRYALAKADIPFDLSLPPIRPYFTLARHADFTKGIPAAKIAPVTMTVDRITLYVAYQEEAEMTCTEIGYVEAGGWLRIAQ